MKKALLATSALVMMAGAAAAEVAVSGSARMGVVYFDDSVGTDTYFSSRVRIVFTASGETDTGLSFGASVRADQFGGNSTAQVVTPGEDGIPGNADDEVITVGSGGTTNGDSTVWISGGFGKLTMGDVSGAADALVGQTSGVGYGPNDSLQEINFIGQNKTAIYYEYTTGSFTFGAGVGQTSINEDTYTIGAKYAEDTYSVAIGWERNTGIDVDMISASGSVTFGPATIKAKVADVDFPGADTVYSLSLDYVIGPTTITAFYTDYGNDQGGFNGSYEGGTDTQHYGLGVAYDLGGGATLAGGIVQQNNTGVEDATFADLGLKFSF